MRPELRYTLRFLNSITCCSYCFQLWSSSALPPDRNVRELRIARVAEFDFVQSNPNSVGIVGIAVLVLIQYLDSMNTPVEIALVLFDRVVDT